MMTWTTADWIGLGFAAVLYSVMLLAFYLVGSYELTGVRGWRRIPAGTGLFWYELVIMVSRWEAKLSKHHNRR